METGRKELGKDSEKENLSWRPGLSSRLLGLTVLFVLIAEALVFLPSLGNFRTSWLNERLEMAQTAVLALDAAREMEISDKLSRDLLENAQIVSVATADMDMRQMVLSPAMTIDGEVRTVDMRNENMLDRIFSAVMLSTDRRADFLRVVQTPTNIEGIFVELILEAEPLRQEMTGFLHRILWLSLFLSALIGSAIYFSLYFVVVRPIQRITRSIERFRDDPRDWTSRIVPSNRVDEIGRAETTLSDMETTVKGALKERERLAQLGEAMAKINHDLRNSLTAAQIVSDGLTLSEDPRVQKAAPRLERAIERAITLAEDTLQFGRTNSPDVKLENWPIREVVEEAAYEALASHQSLVWLNDVDENLIAQIDHDHLHRIIVNLLRNAAQAITATNPADGTGRLSVCSPINGSDIPVLHIMDNGPGIPAKVTETLFKPFSFSGSRKGSGLGLAIAKELASGMDANLSLLKTDDEGTVFELTLISSKPYN